MNTVDRVVDALLYEGYMLYPYRRSAVKNQVRWTFGCVYPRQYSDASGGIEPCQMQTQCLVTGGGDTQIEITARFLHVVERTISENVYGSMHAVESLRVDDQVYQPWEEAKERQVSARFALSDLAEQKHHIEINVNGERNAEKLVNAAGNIAGTVNRQWRQLKGSVIVSAHALSDSAWRLNVEIDNITPLTDLERKSVIWHTFVSTHTVLSAHGGEFVSLLEPPEEYQEAASTCRNIHTWPVLIGRPGEHDTVLSSPIILYDYPEVSPQSPGDLYDGTEIDELLRISILALTDAEKLEIRESDERSRAILENTEALSPEQLLKLHGVIRNLQEVRGNRK